MTRISLWIIPLLSSFLAGGFAMADENRVPDAPNVSEENSPAEYQPSPRLMDLLAQLNDLEGLEGVKRKVYLLLAQKAINHELEKREMRKTVPINLNMQFIGPPGTGKTTVARIYGQILKEIGLLENGEFHEFRRADLLSQYLGSATVMTQEAFNASIGGIMFIDEFHNFLNSKDPKDNDPYGKEALGTLVGLMTDEIKGKQVVVIVAGYRAGMENVMRQDDGLRSRIPESIDFGTLTNDQLVSIFIKRAKSTDYVIVGQFVKALKERIVRAKQAMGPGFGNGRYINFLFSQAVENQMLRIASSLKQGVHLNDFQLKEIQGCDLPPPEVGTFGEEEAVSGMSDEIRRSLYI